jgi:hypothetical protein
MKPTAKKRALMRVREEPFVPKTIETVPDELALVCTVVPRHSDMDEPSPCNLNKPICYHCHRIFWQTGAAQRATDFAAKVHPKGSRLNVRWNSRCSKCTDTKAPWRWLGGELGFRKSESEAHKIDRELADSLTSQFLWHIRALILDYVGDECEWFSDIGPGRAENSQDLTEYRKGNEKPTGSSEPQRSISQFFKKV